MEVANPEHLVPIGRGRGSHLRITQCVSKPLNVHHTTHHVAQLVLLFLCLIYELGPLPRNKGLQEHWLIQETGLRIIYPLILELFLLTSKAS